MPICSKSFGEKGGGSLQEGFIEPKGRMRWVLWEPVWGQEAGYEVEEIGGLRILDDAGIFYSYFILLFY